MNDRQALYVEAEMAQSVLREIWWVVIEEGELKLAHSLAVRPCLYPEALALPCAEHCD